MTDNISRMLKPIHDMQKIMEPFNKIQESLQPIIRMQKAFEKIHKAYLVSVPKFEFSFNKQLEEFQKINQRLKEYCENTPKFLLLIAEYGWFIELDSELRFPYRIANEIENGNEEVAENCLIEYYTLNLERIFKNLHDRHPNRSGILNEIIEGHKNKRYNLTIPTTLTQVDGICFDFTEKKFFIKDKKITIYQK